MYTCIMYATLNLIARFVSVEQLCTKDVKYLEKINNSKESSQLFFFLFLIVCTTSKIKFLINFDHFQIH